MAAETEERAQIVEKARIRANLSNAKNKKEREDKGTVQKSQAKTEYGTLCHKKARLAAQLKLSQDSQDRRMRKINTHLKYI